MVAAVWDTHHGVYDAPYDTDVDEAGGGGGGGGSMMLEPLRTCSLITTSSATSAVSWLHDRMPVILDGDALAAWLDPSTSVDTALSLLR